MTRITKPGGERLRVVTKDGLSILALVISLLVARATIADHYVVPTSSMNPTVRVDDRLVVNKMAYGLRVPFTEIYLADFEGPKHGDVVVLDSPNDSNVLLKRVVACPGDVVEVSKGHLFLNHTQVPVMTARGELSEDLLGKTHPVSFAFGGGPDFGPVKVPSDHYLMMGDNRGMSLDGRSFGFVKRNTIYGKAVAVYWRELSPVWRRL